MSGCYIGAGVAGIDNAYDCAVRGCDLCSGELDLSVDDLNELNDNYAAAQAKMDRAANDAVVRAINNQDDDN